MRTVALAGGAAETREGIRESKADEVWTLNWSYKYDYIPRIDRLFEMHPIWLYSNTGKPMWEKPARHWEWLNTQQAGYPIYMLDYFPGISGCVRYPIEEVSQDLFGERLVKGQSPHVLYTSSFDYMMALAIHEGFNVIETYGFEMGSITEYRYQREGAAFFVGLAIGRGITVSRPANSVLLRSKIYGYQGGQMIFRQDLEHHLASWDEQRNAELARLQHLEGQYTAIEQKAEGEELEAMRIAISRQRERAVGAANAYQAVAYLIQEVDLEEPEIKIIEPLGSVPIGNLAVRS